jgi:hypothetical protein
MPAKNLILSQIRTAPDLRDCQTWKMGETARPPRVTNGFDLILSQRMFAPNCADWKRMRDSRRGSKRNAMLTGGATMHLKTGPTFSNHRYELDSLSLICGGRLPKLSRRSAPSIKQ